MVWLLLYVMSNFIAGIIMYNTGALVGDVEGFPISNYSYLYMAVSVEIFCYFFIMMVLFNFFHRIKMKQIFKIADSPKSRIIAGKIVLLLQVSYLIFNFREGINIAGSDNKSTSIFNTFWVFVPIDLIFLIYYGFHREDSYFKYNLTAYIVSNLMRGWSGIFLYVMFYEWCRSYRMGTIKAKRILLIVLSTILLYPFLLGLKWAVRVSAAEKESAVLLFQTFTETVDIEQYSEGLTVGLDHLIGRLQHSSVIIELIQNKETIQERYDAGLILPYYKDGLPQLTYRKINHQESAPNLGVAITQIFFSSANGIFGAWNVSTGFSGWFYILNGYSPIYVLYMFMLCLLSVFFTKQLGDYVVGGDVVWLAWLTFLMQGWIMAFIGFSYAVLLFILIRLLSQYLSRFSIKAKS